MLIKTLYKEQNRDYLYILFIANFSYLAIELLISVFGELWFVVDL